MMQPKDVRIAAALTVLRDNLAPVVDEFVLGRVSDEDRAELAHFLHAIAYDLEPATVIEQGEVIGKPFG